MDSDKIIDIYLKVYEDKIEGMYKHIVEHHLEAFPILRFKDYLYAAHFVVDKETFSSEEYLVIFDNIQSLSGKHDLTSIDDDLSRILVDEFKWNRFNKVLEVRYPELTKRNILKILKLPFGLYDRKGDISNSSIEPHARNHVEEDYRSWNKENKTPVSKFNHDNISSHSHLDYDVLVKKFKSSEFKDDFIYQMNQAEECYKRHLYLPAAATLSVALETVLTDLCNKNNIKITNNNMLNQLGQELQQRGIINYRLGKRIDITYSLRNSLAHTNKGEVSKDDCSIILSCMRTIIEEHY